MSLSYLKKEIEKLVLHSNSPHRIFIEDIMTGYIGFCKHSKEYSISSTSSIDPNFIRSNANKN